MGKTADYIAGLLNRQTISSDTINSLTSIAYSKSDGRHAPAAMQGLLDCAKKNYGFFASSCVFRIEEIAIRIPQHAQVALNILAQFSEIEFSKHESDQYVKDSIADTARAIGVADAALAIDAMRLIAKTPSARQAISIKDIAFKHPKHAPAALANLTLIAKENNGLPLGQNSKRNKSVAAAVRQISTLDDTRGYAIQTLKEIGTPHAMNELYMMATHEKIGNKAPQERAYMNVSGREAFQSMHSMAVRAITSLPDFKLSTMTIDMLSGMSTPKAAQAIADIATHQTAAQKKHAGKFDINLFLRAIDALENKADDDTAEALSVIGQRMPTGTEAIIALAAIRDLYKNGINAPEQTFTLETVHLAAAKLAFVILDHDNLKTRIASSDVEQPINEAAVSELRQLFESVQQAGLFPVNDEFRPSQLLEKNAEAIRETNRVQRKLGL